ncbi:MAG: hypothetical protein ABJB16_10120 [Saprospiraceae bacterium]
MDINSDFPSTGYTTVENMSRRIKNFIFVNSPDTRNNRIKIFQSKEAIDNYLIQQKNEFPNDIKCELNKDQKFVLSLNSSPFARIAIIELTALQLGEFVKTLANYLAQPIQENWDGITIKDLIAA